MNSALELRSVLKQAKRALSTQGARVHFPSASSLTKGLATGHFHLRAEFFFQQQASTLFEFPGETLLLGPGEVLIVPGKLLHAETVVEGDSPFRNVVLYADESSLSCHLADQSPQGRPRIAYPEHRVGPDCGRVAGWLEDAVETHRLFGDRELTVALVLSILELTLKLLDHPSSLGQQEPLPVVRCRRLIHENLGNPELSVASLAKGLGCNPDYLSHLFREVRGEKLSNYIEDLRMGRAAELLRETTLSCKEVAWASGYASQSYFIRCFRRRWKASPAQWRLAQQAPRRSGFL